MLRPVRNIWLIKLERARRRVGPKKEGEKDKQAGEEAIQVN